MESEKPKPQNPDNVTINTTNGHVVVVKGYVSGGAAEEMQRVFMENVRFDFDPSTGKVDDSKQTIAGTVSLDKTKKALELLVVSVDGSTENCAEAVRDLPKDDYYQVTDKLDEISGPLVKPKSTS